MPDLSSGCELKRSWKEHVNDWVCRRMELGISRSRSSLLFLYSAKKLGDCRICHRFQYPGEEDILLCSVRSCGELYHQECVKKRLQITNMRKFTCSQHVCFNCGKQLQWRCVHCIIASHDKCAAWPDEVIHLVDQPGRAICWRHPTDWRENRKEVFCQLPLPYIEQEFKIDLWWKHIENNVEPPLYTHIRRNIYLVKKKLDGVDDIGCRSCTSVFPGQGSMRKLFKGLPLFCKLHKPSIFEGDQDQNRQDPTLWLGSRGS